MAQLYGPCEGGPYAGKRLVHHTSPMLVAIEIDPETGRQLTVLHAQVSASRAFPCVVLKAYVWDADAKLWRWDTTERHRIETAK